MSRCTGVAIGVVLLAGCGDIFFECPAADPSQLDAFADRLGDTGLYADIATGEIASGVIPYQPRFELWSDGASKRRWLWLPEGSAIDTSDMDAWQFPVGTRLWKEFSQGGTKIETRMLARTGPGPGQWQAASYRWIDDQTAELQPLGALDARGTNHDIPASGECIACHGGRESFVLGFSAIQLASGESGAGASIAELSAAGRFTSPPPARVDLPGDETAQRALGYLHANCGHCHNADRPRETATCFDPKNRMDLWLRLSTLESVQTTSTYQSTVPDRIVPGRPGASLVIDRMSRRTFIYGMPPLGTETVDDDAVRVVSQFIRELQ